MKKILRLLFVSLSITSAFSQSLYFKTGKNFTNYVFESSSSGIQSSVVKLQMDSGSFYELGTALPFGSSRFSYECGISLNELNSLVEIPSKAVKYKTEYIGLDNSLLFSIVKTKRVLWDAKLGFGLQTLIFGKEEIGGVLYDLKQFNEFNGLFFRQVLGTQIKLVTSNQLNFSLGYDFHYDVFNTKNTSNQSLLINTNQVKFGIYYKFDNKNSQNYVNQLNDTNTNNTKINSVINSTIDLKNEPEKKSSKTNKDDLASQLSSSNLPVNNTEKNKVDNNSSRIVKNLNSKEPSASNNSNLKSTLVETKINKVLVNETNTSLGSNKSTLPSDLRSTRVETKVPQNNLIVKQVSNSNSTNSPNISVNKSLNPSVNGNNQNLNGTPLVSTAIKNLSNSNSNIEQVLQNKPMSETSKNSKSFDLQLVKSNTDSAINSNDILSAIMSRLNIIENKLNQIEKKK
jgi:hypothetical protein